MLSHAMNKQKTEFKDLFEARMETMETDIKMHDTTLVNHGHQINKLENDMEDLKSELKSLKLSTSQRSQSADRGG
eukprot:10997256-Karenia_brevis.AAC.1